jgi:hypothetical protein
LRVLIVAACPSALTNITYSVSFDDRKYGFVLKVNEELIRKYEDFDFVYYGAQIFFAQIVAPIVYFHEVKDRYRLMEGQDYPCIDVLTTDNWRLTDES